MFDECTDEDTSGRLRVNGLGQRRLVLAGVLSGLACDLFVNVPFSIVEESRAASVAQTTGGRYIAGEGLAIMVLGSLPFLLGGGVIAGVLLASLLNAIFRVMPPDR